MLIDSLIVIDDNGMPKPPTVRQLIDKDIRELYTRDKTPDKKNYIAEAIVICYLGDPKSPARQAGLNKDYIPDKLVIRLISRYYDENITEAGKVVENILKTVHNINLSLDVINNLLNEKLNSNITLEEIPNVMNLIDAVSKKAGDIPSILKKLEEAKQNLMYEKETEIGRGGQAVLSSMDAEEYTS